MADTDLTGIQKVAILLAGMDQGIAASVLQQLEPDIMTQVADAIRSLGVVAGEVRNKAISDCMRDIVEMGDAVQGDETTINSLLTQAIGEKKAAAILQDRSAIGHAAFHNLSDVSADQIAAILAGEQPNVIAVVLRYLSAQKAADILAMLPSEVRKRAVVFMCTGNPPPAEVLAKVEQFMEARTGQKDKNTKRKTSNTDKLETVTGILQHVGRDVQEALLTAIEDNSESLGNEVRDMLFTFEDIVKVSDVAMRRILQEIDTTLLAVALRSASINLREKVFKNMSKRAGQAIKEDMEYSRKMKLSEIQEKQKEIVNVIRSLQADGQISIGEEEEEQYV